MDPRSPSVPTAVRVPVLYARHSEALWVETQEPLTVAQVQEAIRERPTEQYSSTNHPRKEYTSHYSYSGKDPVYVGRIRKDLTNPNG